MHIIEMPMAVSTEKVQRPDPSDMSVGSIRAMIAPRCENIPVDHPGVHALKHAPLHAQGEGRPREEYETSARIGA
jgi:hypothetical protein